jgi:hypothetical protein
MNTTATLPLVATSTTSSPAVPGRGSVWTGRILGALPALFLLFDGTIKVLQTHWAMEGTAQVGYPTSIVLPLGIVELACVVAYVFPRTAALGAAVLTAYLGGAVATHVRLGQPYILPILFGVILWLGLYLRDERIRALVGPGRSRKAPRGAP